MRIRRRSMNIDNKKCLQERGPLNHRAMEDFHCFPVVQSRRLKREAGAGTETQPAGQEVHTEEVTSIKMKQEELSDMPRKVPRFQYVDFPSLHKCIQQLAVPPLNSWLGRCPPPPRPASLAPTNARDGEPKFKYVDYPSLHHCIQQLSVPPLESWSSGLLRPEVNNSSTKVGTGAVKLDMASQKHSTTSVHKPDTVTAGAIQDPVVSDVPLPVEHQALSCLTSDARPPFGSDETQAQPGATDKEHTQLEALDKTKLSLLGSFPPNPRLTCLASITTTDPVDTNKGPSPLGNVQSDGHLHRMQFVCPPKNKGTPEKCLWRTLPESECPFCQKMFEDPEELKVHERSHRDKKPH